VQIVGFIIRISITIHGHLNVKLTNKNLRVLKKATSQNNTFNINVISLSFSARCQCPSAVCNSDFVKCRRSGKRLIELVTLAGGGGRGAGDFGHI